MNFRSRFSAIVPGDRLRMSEACASTSGCDNDEVEDEQEPGLSESDDTDTFCDAKRPKQLLDTAYQSWKSGLYTDVAVIIGENKFLAHRLVLASLSDYFPPLLKFDENNSGEVTLHNIDPDDFVILLKYAYTGDVDINKDNVQSVLIAADYLSVSQVKDMCIKFMTANFDLDNICDVLMFGIEYTLSELVENAKQFLKENLGDVSQMESFSKLEPKVLEKFFKDDDLVVYSNKVSLKSADRETLILNTVLRYLSMRPSDPGDIEMLIRTVRLPQIPTDVIMKCLSNYKSFKNDQIIKKYVQLREVAVKHIQEKRHDQSKATSLEPGEIPECWFRSRKYAVCSFVQRSMRYAAEGQIEETPDPPECVYSDCNLEIKKIEIWLRIWDNKSVIGGLSLSYRNPSDDGRNLVYRKGSCPGRCHHTVELQPDEFIIRVTIGSGWLIDRLGFETNRGRIFGPFGGHGGNEYTESAPAGPLSYLYDINCDSVDTQESEAIFNLMLRWITFS